MKNLLLSLIFCAGVFEMQAQVTQINSNRSLQPAYPLSPTKEIFVSATDHTLWVTDGTLAGTIQLSPTIEFVDGIGSTSFLNGQFLFAGTLLGTGTELYVTDGTPAGTQLVRDINFGPASSDPGESAVLNGFVYFTATTPLEGRELWRTNGTLAGTTLVKDIITGPPNSNAQGSYQLFSTGTYLLFAAGTTASGLEIYKSDGTSAGTAMLKDLNTGNGGADSSNPRDFFMLNSTVLFTATNAGAGDEIWRTDGTAGGTFQLADINPGGASSTEVELFPGTGMFNRYFLSFHAFNNKAYFVVNNGTSAGVLWSTDGTVANTSFVKDIVSSPSQSFIFVVNAINLPGKFIFPVADFSGRSELWQSDGTTGGTVIFKAFDPAVTGRIPTIFIPFSLTGGTPAQQLFQGNKFFFTATTAAEGSELWISDGVDATPAHTQMVKNIDGGPGDGVDPTQLSYCYTTTDLFFPANNITNGQELWRSNGTSAGTTLVADIVTNTGDSDPSVNFYIVNNKVLFEADNGDNPDETDLYAVDGTFTPLPISLGDFTVNLKSGNAQLQWHTLQELNSKDFTVQRSVDGVNFDNIGKVAAAGNSATRRTYNLIDPGVMSLGKPIIYYRLLSTDIDGKSVVSPVITLRLKNSGQWTIQLLANPVPGNIKVLLAGVKDNISLSVLDMNGRQVYKRSLQAVNGQVVLPAESLPKGTYILVAESNKEMRSVQFIK